MSASFVQKGRYHCEACCDCKVVDLCLPSGFRQPELKNISQSIDQDYTVEVGENICFSGEKFRYLYAIKSGSAKDVTIDLHGNEHVVDFYLPGEIIGLDAISTGKYSYDTIALEPTIVCLIPFNVLLKLALNMPKLQRRLMYLTSQKLFNRTQALLNHHFSAEERLAAFLINLGNRYKNIGFSAKNYYLSMSRYDIGNYLNLTPETVSRILSKFQQKGILMAHKKHIQLLR